MLCPSCGKEAVDTDSLCNSCGRSLSPATPPSAQSVPIASVVIPPGTPEQPLRRSRKAISSLILSIVPFLVVIALGLLVATYGVDPQNNFLGFSIFCLSIMAWVLAVILGHRARGLIRRNADRLRGGRIATIGLVLGYVGLACVIVFLIPPSDPNRVIANQAVTVGSLRIINTAAITYATAYNHGFPPNLDALGPPKTDNPNASVEPSEKAAGLIDEPLASGSRAGYRFTYIAGPVDSSGKIQTYMVHADPVEPGVSGKMHFFTDQTQVIRQKSQGEAGANDSPIGG